VTPAIWNSAADDDDDDDSMSSSVIVAEAESIKMRTVSLCKVHAGVRRDAFIVAVIVDTLIKIECSMGTDELLADVSYDMGTCNNQ